MASTLEGATPLMDTAPPNPKPICYLTDRLSAELRLEIYKHVLRSEHPLRTMYHGPGYPIPGLCAANTSILQLNKAIHYEAEPVFYEVNTIATGPVSLIRHDETYGPAHCDNTMSDPKIVHLRIKCSEFSDYDDHPKRMETRAQSATIALIDRLHRMPGLRTFNIECDSIMVFRSMWRILPQSGAKGLRVGIIECVGWPQRVILTHEPLARGWEDFNRDSTRHVHYTQMRLHHWRFNDMRDTALEERKVPLQLERFFEKDLETGDLELKIGKGSRSEALVEFTLSLMEWLGMEPRPWVTLDAPVSWGYV